MRTFIALAMALLGADASAQVLAVLEHPHCASSPERAVRSLFTYGPDGWRRAAPSDPVPESGARWWSATAEFAELDLQTRPPPRKPEASWTFARDFYLVPISPEMLPEAPNSSGDFGGWCEPPKNRPLPLISRRGFLVEGSRPAHAPLSDVQRQILLRALLRTYGSRKLCTTHLNNESKTTPIRLSASDLIPRVSFSLDKSRVLVGLDLKRPASACNSERRDIGLPRWFVLSRSARYLGAGLTLIQQLQMTSERERYYLFWYTGYNEDGYVLYNESFSNPLRYTWKYH